MSVQPLVDELHAAALSGKTQVIREHGNAAPLDLECTSTLADRPKGLANRVNRMSPQLHRATGRCQPALHRRAVISFPATIEFAWLPRGERRMWVAL